MLPREHSDRIHVAFDDHRLVANAGLLLPSSLALRLGLGELVDKHVDLGDAPGRANPGDKLLTLVASALAGGDCIDDADALRSGGTARVLGCVVKAPSTLGTFLRSFLWGHVRQLDRVSRELLARAWAARAGPRDWPLTIDLDSPLRRLVQHRHAATHRFVSVHIEGVPDSSDWIERLSWPELLEESLESLRITRRAILYLAQMIHIHEKATHVSDSPGSMTMPLPFERTNADLMEPG